MMRRKRPAKPRPKDDYLVYVVLWGALLLAVASALTARAIRYVEQTGCHGAACTLRRAPGFSLLAFGWLAVAVLLIPYLAFAITRWRLHSGKSLRQAAQNWQDRDAARKAAKQAAADAEATAAYQRIQAQQDVAAQRQLALLVEDAGRKRTTKYIRAELKNDGLLRWRILARDGYKCRHCGATGARAELTIDHITPVSLGGTNAESNLQTLCRSCNSRKGARI